MSVLLSHIYHSQGAGSHDIIAGDNGHIYCTCIGWRTSKHSPKMCKHLRNYATTDPELVRRYPSLLMLQYDERRFKAYPGLAALPHVHPGSDVLCRQCLAPAGRALSAAKFVLDKLEENSKHYAEARGGATGRAAIRYQPTEEELKL